MEPIETMVVDTMADVMVDSMVVGGIQAHAWGPGWHQVASNTHDFAPVEQYAERSSWVSCEVFSRILSHFSYALSNLTPTSRCFSGV